MHCSGCAHRIEQALRTVPGVREAAVQLLAESASVRFGAGSVPSGRLIAAVRAVGYDAEVVASAAELLDRLSGDAEEKEKKRRRRQELIQAIMYAAPILVLDHLQHLIWSPTPASQVAGRMLQFALLVMLAISPAGSPILVSGLRAAWSRAPNMDLLITMGFLVATVSSIYGSFTRDESFVHLHAAAMILLLVCVGRYLEGRARNRASATMAALARRAPKTALVQRGSDLVETAVEDIQVGDLVRVPAHAAIPVDGEVIEGSAGVDESLITGESLPITRRPGDPVKAGTIVTDGAILLHATAIGDRSTLGRIVQLVALAQAGRTPLQRLADQAAAIFTPFVILLSVATLIGWLLLGGRAAAAVSAAIAVLVVSCPCALGLATPTVIMVASGLAALRGILVRDPAMLEAMGSADVVVWDKTGTLTAGTPSVQQITPSPGESEKNILYFAASAEQFSSHPVARSIVAEARRQHVDLKAPAEFESVPGEGVRALVDDCRVQVGSPLFVGAPRADGNGEGSETLVAVNEKVIGRLQVSDSPRPSAADAVRRLREMNVRSEMLTGDAKPHAERIAREIGVDDFLAGVDPAAKLARIRELQRAGRRVAMVGDGVNDAAALAAADVGIAFATGADVAAEAAGIQLIGSTPHLVADSVFLARVSRRTMRQNLFWAVIYNALMIPLAAANQLSPGWAAGAMMISSLTVVLNALRLPSVLGWKNA